mmetsp:Transcript_6766/g.24967  ORF Transcript_6766/g.24967 Transcript_6766/m.24967 type:complete len:228 (+) Transcript_6766:466-1149(+)
MNDGRRHRSHAPLAWNSGYRSAFAVASAVARATPFFVVSARTRSTIVSSISSWKQLTGNVPVTHAASRRFRTASFAFRVCAGFRSDSRWDSSAQSARRSDRRTNATSSLYATACVFVNRNDRTSRVNGGRRMSDFNVRIVVRSRTDASRDAASARACSRASWACDARSAAAAPSNSASGSRSVIAIRPARAPFRVAPFFENLPPCFPLTPLPPFAPVPHPSVACSGL